MTIESNNVYDKRKLIILRAALIVIGGVLGGVAVWQYFVYYPELMRREFQIIIIVVSACVLAGILGLSAKPFYRLFSSIGVQLSPVLHTLGVRGVVAVIAGLVASGMLGYLFDIIIREHVQVWAVRILADILVACVFAVLCCFGFTKWVAADEQNDFVAAPRASVGYLLTASCFTDDRVFTAAYTLNNVKVSSYVFQALCILGDGAAIDRLNAVLSVGVVARLRGGDEFGSLDEYIRAESALAKAKRLKLVYADGVKEFEAADGALGLSVFSMPTDAVTAAFRRVGESADDGDTTAKSDEKTVAAALE